MFLVPFQYGSAWDAKADANAEPVAVISKEMNEKLFGGANSVGRTVRLEDRDFRVVGVLDPWTPNIKFYDPTQNVLAPPENIFISFGQLIPMKLRTFGNSDGWGPSPATPGFEGILVSETVWIQMWVELPDAAAVSAYHGFLDAYALEQKKTRALPQAAEQPRHERPRARWTTSRSCRRRRTPSSSSRSSSSRSAR